MIFTNYHITVSYGSLWIYLSPWFLVLSWCYWFVVGANTLWTVQAWHRCFPTSVFLRKTARQTQNTTCDEQLPLHSHVLPKAKLTASERACARVAPTERHLHVHRWPIAGWSALPLGAKTKIDKGGLKWSKETKMSQNKNSIQIQSVQKGLLNKNKWKKTLRKRHLSFLTLTSHLLLNFSHLHSTSPSTSLTSWSSPLLAVSKVNSNVARSACSPRTAPASRPAERTWKKVVGKTWQKKGEWKRQYLIFTKMLT